MSPLPNGSAYALPYREIGELSIHENGFHICIHQTAGFGLSGGLRRCHIAGAGITRGEDGTLEDDARVGAGRTGYSAPALEKGLDVIELLAKTGGGLTVTEIAAALNLSISQIFRMIVVMEKRGWLFRDPSDRYRVTYKVLDVAFRATPAQELAHVATPVMYALSNATNQACHLVVRQEASALVVVRQESPGTIGFSLRPGTIVNLFASSSGHVLLAFAEAKVAELLVESAPRGVDRKAIAERLSLVRNRGYESQDSARVRGVRDVSYPIFGFDRGVVAALTIPYVTFIDGTPGVSLEDAREKLGAAAAEISEGMGHRTDSLAKQNAGAGQTS